MQLTLHRARLFQQNKTESLFLLTPSHLSVTLPLSLQREGQSEQCELGVSEITVFTYFIFQNILKNKEEAFCFLFVF